MAIAAEALTDTTPSSNQTSVRKNRKRGHNASHSADLVNRVLEPSTNQAVAQPEDEAIKRRRLNNSELPSMSSSSGQQDSAMPFTRTRSKTRHETDKAKHASFISWEHHSANLNDVAQVASMSTSNLTSFDTEVTIPEIPKKVSKHLGGIVPPATPATRTRAYASNTRKTNRQHDAQSRPSESKPNAPEKSETPNTRSKVRKENISLFGSLDKDLRPTFYSSTAVARQAKATRKSPFNNQHLELSYGLDEPPEDTQHSPTMMHDNVDFPDTPNRAFYDFGSSHAAVPSLVTSRASQAGGSSLGPGAIQVVLEPLSSLTPSADAPSSRLTSAVNLTSCDLSEPNKAFPLLTPDQPSLENADIMSKGDNDAKVYKFGELCRRCKREVSLGPHSRESKDLPPKWATASCVVM